MSQLFAIKFSVFFPNVIMFLPMLHAEQQQAVIFIISKLTNYFHGSQFCQ